MQQGFPAGCHKLQQGAGGNIALTGKEKKDFLHALVDKGSIPAPKRMNFRKSSEGGGGIISDPKIYVAKFGPLNRAFSA